MSEDRVVVRVARATADLIKAYQDERGLSSMGHATDALVAMGEARRRALAKYAKKAKKGGGRRGAAAPKAAAAKRGRRPRGTLAGVEVTPSLTGGFSAT